MKDKSTRANVSRRVLSPRRARHQEGVPLYLQVKQALEERILSGQLQRGDFLPPEPELCRLFAVSTITIRRALMELARDGLIRRKGGVGTVVAAQSRKIKFALLFHGFDDADWLRRAEIFGSLLGGIGDAAWRANADFSTIRIAADEDALPALKVLADERQFDGVLLRTAGDVDPAWVSLLESRRFPYVAIKRDLEGRPMSFVTVGDVDAARRATEHLIMLGHRRIGLIMGPLDISPRRAIHAGYRSALAARGLVFDEAVVQTAPLGHLPGDAEGFRAMQGLLDGDPRPTAVLVNSGHLAIGVYDAIRQAGLRIPDDVAVVGCGDIGVAAALRPPLTAIETPYAEIGRRAAETLFRAIARPEDGPLEVRLEVPLVVRASCGAHQSGQDWSDEAGLTERAGEVQRLVPSSPARPARTAGAW